MTEKFDGVPVKIGRTVYQVPALTVRLLKKHRATLAGTAKFATVEPTDEELDDLLDMVLDALRRNYPDLTLDMLEDGIDLRSLPLVVKAIAAQTELEQSKAQPGE